MMITMVRPCVDCTVPVTSVVDTGRGFGPAVCAACSAVIVAAFAAAREG
jgi:hypothetical protein